MYYDIFGNSEYFRPESKLPINSFKEIFQHPDPSKIYLNGLENKLKFLELTTADFERKFNEFASSPALLTDPAKHASFLNTVVDAQFAMILVGIEQAELNLLLRKKDNLEQAARLIPEQIDELRINQQIYKRTCEYYAQGVYKALILTNKNQSDFITQLKIQQEKLYPTLKEQAIKQLDTANKNWLGQPNWRAERKPAKQLTAAMTQEIEKLQPKAKKINESLTRAKQFIARLKETNNSTLLEAKKIIDTFDFVTSGTLLSRGKLFGSPSQLVDRTNNPAFIDLIFQLFNSCCAPNSIKLNADPLVTLHQEQNFLINEIETKLLSLQELTIKRNSFPKKYSPVLFAYILNLMLFTILIKDPQRKSLIGLDTKTWDAQLRLICHYPSKYVDTLLKQYQISEQSTLPEQKSLLIPHFKKHWSPDYFNTNLSTEVKAASRTASLTTIVEATATDNGDDNDWDRVSEDGTEA